MDVMNPCQTHHCSCPDDRAGMAPLTLCAVLHPRDLLFCICTCPEHPAADRTGDFSTSLAHLSLILSLFCLQQKVWSLRGSWVHNLWSLLDKWCLFEFLKARLFKNIYSDISSSPPKTTFWEKLCFLHSPLQSVLGSFLQNVNDFSVAAEPVPFAHLEAVTLGVRELSHVPVCSPRGTDGFSLTVTGFEGQNSFSALGRGRSGCSSMQLVWDKVFYHFSAVAVFCRPKNMGFSGVWKHALVWTAFPSKTWYRTERVRRGGVAVERQQAD